MTAAVLDPLTATARRFAVVSAATAATAALPGPCSVVSFGDPGHLPAPFKAAALVDRRLHLAFHDCAADVPWATRPTRADAERLLAFVAEDTTGLIVCQCDAGAGRSVATAAALLRIAGRADRHVRRGTKYDRGWYKQLLQAAHVEPDVEPLASLAVRVKYPADRLLALLLSLRRQRYDNWEAVAVTDGPNPEAAALVAGLNDPRVRLLETPERLGRWGHPYRQAGLDACRGDYLGMANDDDYYAPGYLEQMVQALEWTPADLALSSMIHSYFGWQQCQAFVRGPEVSADVGCWLARADLVRAVPWQGEAFTSDGDYVRRLAEWAVKRGSNVATVERPLHVKN